MIELTIEVATVPVCSPMRTSIVNLPGKTYGADLSDCAMLLLLVQMMRRLWHKYLDASARSSSSVRAGVNFILASKAKKILVNSPLGR
jgi:hypothetical protein